MTRQGSNIFGWEDPFRVIYLFKSHKKSKCECVRAFVCVEGNKKLDIWKWKFVLKKKSNREAKIGRLYSVH